MTAPALRLVLGSRSPRRLELLRLIVPPQSIEVVPPGSSQEAGFESARDWAAIEATLLEIARAKCRDVVERLRLRASAGKAGPARTVVIAADTIVVVGGRDASPVVLGQPPAGEAGRATVRGWFTDYYAGKTHAVATGLCVAEPGSGRTFQRVVTSAVTFRDDVEAWLDWYLETGEPFGKAGGYALQGAGSLFVTRVDGSLSNVVGLPLGELAEILRELGALTSAP
jgi:septum formation protein